MPTPIDKKVHWRQMNVLVPYWHRRVNLLKSPKHVRKQKRLTTEEFAIILSFLKPKRLIRMQLISKLFYEEIVPVMFRSVRTSLWHLVPRINKQSTEFLKRFNVEFFKKFDITFNHFNKLYAICEHTAFE